MLSSELSSDRGFDSMTLNLLNLGIIYNLGIIIIVIAN